MKKKIVCFMFIIGSLLLFYYTCSYIINRIVCMIDNGVLIPFYKNVVGVDDSYNGIVNNVSSFFKSINWGNIKAFFVKMFHAIFNPFTLIIVSYIIQFIVILKVCFLLWISGSNKKYKTSIFAKGLIKTFVFVHGLLGDLFQYICVHKRKVIIIFLMCSGILPVVVFEGVLFIVDYFMSAITLTSHIMLFSLFKWLIVTLIDFIIYGNKILLVVFCAIIYYLLATNRAWKKLRSNWVRFKMLVDDGVTLHQVEGEPGAGKTLTLSQVGIAQTELMLDSFEKATVEFEINYPTFNFAYIRLLLRIFYLDFAESEIGIILKTRPNIMFDLCNLHPFINTEISKYMFNSYYRGTCVVSLIPMTDPYNDSFTRIGNVQSMRFFKKINELPYEPYMSIIFPEIDKEFNSHDSVKEIGDDGTFAFFALVSHLLERTGSVWFDAQDKDQLAKRIRGIAGKYYHLESKEVKTPLMLMPVYRFVLTSYNKLLKILTTYLGRRPKTEKKWTVRRSATVYKRNNLSFFYQLLKYVALGLNRLVGYLEKFQFFQITGEVSTNDEFKNSRKIKYNLNVMDFEHEGQKIYNSTQFKKFYDDLKTILWKEKGLKQNLLLVDKWTSLDPSLLEFAKTGQRNYARIIEAQFKNENKGD